MLFAVCAFTFVLGAPNAEFCTLMWSFFALQSVPVPAGCRDVRPVDVSLGGWNL